MTKQTVNVWDALVRLFHWCLVVSFAIAWLTSDDWADLHQWAGYAASALIVVRLVWGLVGTHYARFSQFLRKPSTVINYTQAMLQRQEPRYIGHNPVGSLMVIALIIVIAITSATGWMYTLDAFWGVEWLEELHEIMANLLLLMVILHVVGVIYASYRHKENMVKSMFTGKKRMPEAGDIA